jgi:serine/threonine protein kinase
MDSLTMTGTVLGTAGYLSPEQAQGERAGAASDRYALAIVAWELLTGRRPFESESTTAEAAAHINAPIPAISLVGKLPRELDPVFERALAKDPATRYGTASEFVAGLRAAFSDAAGSTSEIPAVDVPQTSPTRTLRPAEEVGYPPLPTGPHPSRSVWPLLVALLLIGALGGALLAYFLTRGDGRTQTQTVVTRIQRVTTQGQVTTVETVTSSPAPAPAAPSQGSSQSGEALNDAGYSKMQAGDYAGALPLLAQAVRKLQGTGKLYEAYASYNLAYTRFQLGNCDDVLALLDRAESIEGPKPAIDRLREQAGGRC